MNCIEVDACFIVKGPRPITEEDIVFLAKSLVLKHIVPNDDDGERQMYVDVSWGFPIPPTEDEINRASDFVLANIRNFIRIPDGFSIESVWEYGVYDRVHQFWYRQD